MAGLKQKANKTYRQFYRQSAFPAMTFSNLQRREAPLSPGHHHSKTVTPNRKVSISPLSVRFFRPFDLLRGQVNVNRPS